MKNFVIYNRVSTIGQTEGTSLERQEEQNRATLAEKGHEVAAVFSEVGSGSLYFARKQFQTAIRMIEKGEADGIIAYDMERFARHAAFQAVAIDRILRANGAILFVREPFENTPEGNLYRTMKGGVSQYFREKQRLLSMDAITAVAMNGLQPNTTKPPYAYRIVSKSEVKAGLHPGPWGLYEIVPERAIWVEKIYQLRSEGMSLEKIGEYLTREGAPTLYGGKWLTGTVLHILRNEVNKGFGAYRKTSIVNDDDRAREGKNHQKRVRNSPDDWIRIPCDPVVAPELWDLCQTIKAQPEPRAKKPKSAGSGRRKRRTKVYQGWLTDVTDAIKRGDLEALQKLREEVISIDK